MLKLLRRLVFLPVFMIATVPLATLPAGGAQEVQAQEDPIAVVEAFVDALNAGDVDAALEVVADDVTFTLIDSTQSQAGFGKPAFGVALGGAVTVNQQAELQDLAAEGNVVTGVAVITDDEAEAAGVDRVLQLITITLNDAGLIVKAEFTHDETDEQTATYLEFYNDPDATQPPPGVPTIAMAAQSGSGQTGVAAVVDDPDAGITLVGIDIASGVTGVLQPAHVHTGTCEAPGPIVQPLASVLDGGSFSFLSTPPAPSDLGLIINVHKSAAESNVYTSCGVIQAPSAAPAPTVVAPAPTPTAGTGVVAPDAGTGGTGPGARSGFGGFGGIAALITLIGMAAIGVGVLYRRQTHSG